MFCPDCGGEYRDGFFKCAACDVGLVPDPPTLAEPRPLGERQRRPAFIAILMVFLFAFAFLSPLVLGMAAISGPSGFYLNGQAVTRHEFFRGGGLQLILFGGLSFITAYAFWKERWWGRQAATVLMVISFVPSLFMAPAPPGATRQTGATTFKVGDGPPSGGDAVQLLVLFAGAIWYFYQKRSVVTYYQQLAEDAHRLQKA